MELHCTCHAPGWQLYECPAVADIPSVGDSDRLLIIDGSALLHRYYFPEQQNGSGHRVDIDGKSVDALYYATRALLQILGSVRPTHVAVVVDHADGSNGRKAIYPGYRERKEKDAGFARQVDLAASHAWRVMGLRIYQDPTCEADDVIATLAHRWPVRSELYLCCYDKDLLPILDPIEYGPSRTLVQIDEGKIAYKEPAQVALDRFGLQCSQVPDLLALAGDSADSLPGVEGIGMKTAGALLSRYESLWGIYRAIDEGKLDLGDLRGKKRVEELLRAHRDEAIVTRRLVSLDRNVMGVPLELGVFDLAHRWQWIEQGDPAVEGTFEELGLLDLLSKP